MDAFPIMLVCARLIGWTLVHFLWQGMLLGMFYAAARELLPRGVARYRAGMATLILMSICPLLTGWRLLDVAAPVIQAGTDVVMPGVVSSRVLSGTDWSWGSGLDAALPWFSLSWLLGVLLLSWRGWRQWRNLKALVRVAELMPHWQAHVAGMTEKFGLRRSIIVLCSSGVATPALVGWIRPVILMPIAVVCNFPAAQIELILAHELAHVRRWDPLANLFQVALETMYFYHPVVHWVSRDVRNEREICSDELAISISGGSRHEFVTVLAELGELRENHGSMLLAANGGVLLDRVQQMVVPAQEMASIRTSARFVAILLGALFVACAFRLEWKDAQLQRSMSDSFKEWQSILTPYWLPITPVHALRLRALVAVDLDVARPLLDVPLPDALVDRSVLPMDKVLPLSPTRLNFTDLKILPAAPIAPVDERSHPQTDRAGPTPVHIVQPTYPSAALARGVEGTVMVEFSIAADGSVQNLDIVQAKPAGVFDQAVAEAMSGWKYAHIQDADSHRRFRQTMAFVLNTAARNNASSGIYARDQVQGYVGCRIVTGTHICRWPDDTSKAGSMAGMGVAGKTLEH